jgi:2-methylcitrate dehydratase PrpD
MFIATFLGEQLSEIDTVPEAARRHAVKCILDVITASIAGCGTQSGRAVRQTASTIWGHGAAPMWFSEVGLSVAGAAFTNAAAACALDLDDGHRQAAGHPGAPIIPALLALSSERELDAPTLLSAIVLGYEIGVRISASRDLRTVPTTNTGLWCGQAVAAAVAWARGCSATQMGEAIAIAGNTAPNQSATAYTKFRGNNAKEGIPWGAANGVIAATLAQAGFTGPIDILDDASRFNPETLCNGFGDGWHISTSYFKPYSCCRWLHAAIDALVALMDDHAIRAEDIVAIDVQTFSRTLTLGNEVMPQTFEAAQYSMPFCVGVAAVRGVAALLPLDERLLHDTAVLAMSQRVQLTVLPEFDAMFPASTPARVEICTHRARVGKTVLAPRGDPGNPMAWPDIEAKFKKVAHGRIVDTTAQSILHSIDTLKDGDARPLLHGLRHAWRLV